MLKLRLATPTEISRYYNALKLDFDERELLPCAAIRKAVRRGEQEFLLFYDEETGVTEGYALCCTRSVYGYVLLKYFGIFSWYQGHGVGVEAMRLLHRRYADRQGILAELTVFDDSGDDSYMKKLIGYVADTDFDDSDINVYLSGLKPRTDALSGMRLCSSQSVPSMSKKIAFLRIPAPVPAVFSTDRTDILHVPQSNVKMLNKKDCLN